MIEVKNVTKNFFDVCAIDDLSLKISRGIVGLVGQNGSGKSTLLRLIGNVIYQDSGEIFIDGISNNDKESKEKVFFLSDNPYVPYFSNVNDLIELYSSLYKLNKDKFYSIVNSFSLPINRRISGFSKGMKRQLFIALTLSIDAKYYLLDEVFDGLDPLVMNIIKNEFLKLSEEDKVIVISSHNINALQRMADRFLILYKGKIIKDDDSSNDTKKAEFLKYQIISDKPLTESILKELHFNVLSFNKLGSVCHAIFVNEEKALLEEKINKYFTPKFVEEIPIDMEETLSLEMLLAKKEEK